MQADHLRAELKVKKPAAKGSEKEFAALQAKLAALDAELGTQQAAVDGAGQWGGTRGRGLGNRDWVTR